MADFQKPLADKLVNIGIAPFVAEIVVPELSTTVHAEVSGLLQLLDLTQQLNEVTHERDGQYSEQIKEIREKINICLRSHDYNLLLQYFMDKKFHELVDVPDLSENRMLDLHGAETGFAKAMNDRRNELAQAKKESPKRYQEKLARFFGFDVHQPFNWSEVLEVMTACFREVGGLEDHVFSVIEDELGSNEKTEALKSSEYQKIRAIADPLELLTAMDGYYKQAKSLKDQGKNDEARSLLQSAFEVQRMYAWLGMFNLDQRSIERRRAPAFDEYFRTVYLDKVFRHEGLDQDNLDERVKRLREVYNIPVADDGSLKIWFTAIKDQKTGETSVQWDWENNPDFDETPEEGIVFPRFYFDAERGRELLCFCKTDIKTPRSTVEKEIRKQERLKKDINRMNLAFLTLEDKMSEVNSATKNAAIGLSDEDIFRIFERMFPIDTMEENLREDDFQTNPNSHKDYRSFSGGVKVPFQNQGDSRMEVRIHPTPADYLINMSQEHPAGSAQYSKRRVITGVVPRAFRIKTHGEKPLREILYKQCHVCGRKQAKKFLRRPSVQADLDL